MYTTEFEYLSSQQHSRLFLAHYHPSNSAAEFVDRPTVILVPPFAEEMNRSKRMYVLAARLLAQAGYHAICFDYSGTGDSSGEWGQFEYAHWMADLQTVYQAAAQNSAQVSFIGLRFGALLLTDALANGKIDAQQCVLWDPLESGEVLVRQLIRLKIAAEMADDNKKITSQEVKDAIARDGYFESAGYHISQSLLNDISGKTIADNITSLLNKTSVHWMVLGKHRASEQAPQSTWLANSFKADIVPDEHLQARLHMQPVSDVKFWMQQETTISPELLRATQRIFARG